MTADRLPLAKLIAAPVNDLAPYLPGKPLEELEREYGIRDAVKLASNENPYELPFAVREAIRRAIHDLPRYPDGATFALRSALAEQLGVDMDQLTVGNGSNDILVLLAEAFLTPQTNAIYDEYSFVVYRLAVQASGAAARVSPALPRSASQPLGHDLEAMLGLIDDATRLVYIANPNNPTGTWVGGPELRQFLEALPTHVIAVVDEAYVEFAEGDGYASVLPWLNELPNLVVTRTFSKAYGLAGLRIGYSVSSAEVAEVLNRVRQPFNVNSVAQAAALAMLREGDWVHQCVTDNRRELARVRDGLAGLGIDTLPSRGNFVLADMPDADECNEFLLRQGVIVRPVANYGLTGYLRISIGTKSENHRLLAALSAFQARRNR